MAAVIVPQPGRGQHKITALQKHASSLHRTSGACTIDDEAHSLSRVTMSGGVLVPVEPLDRCPESRCREGLALQTGIGERHGPSVSTGTRRLARRATSYKSDHFQSQARVAG